MKEQPVGLPASTAESAAVEAGPVSIPNLRGVPSYHYAPQFAQRVQRALVEFAPDCVALEIPSYALPELLWAVEQWPQPCASVSEGAIFPFVPGDSILEAARLAHAGGIRIEAVDLDVEAERASLASPAVQPNTLRFPVVLPDGEWVEILGAVWQTSLDALLPPPTPSDVAREAWMARRLAELLATGHKVLWVGGAAHWTRITHRLQRADFTSPSSASPSSATRSSHLRTVTRRLERAHLSASALFYLTGRMPLQAWAYSEQPTTYREMDTLSEAANAALAEGEALIPPVVFAAAPASNLDPILELEREQATAVDVARVLLYARNLAATGDLRSTPRVGELLRAAVMVVGPYYAGRLYARLTQEWETLPTVARPDSPSPVGRDATEAVRWRPLRQFLARHEHPHPARTFPQLSYAIRSSIVRGSERGLWLEERPIMVEPYWPAAEAGGALWLLKPPVLEPPTYPSYPPAEGENEDEIRWLSHPADRVSYQSFVRTVFRLAAQHVQPEAHSAPFSSGFGEGIDVRATLQGWARDEIWIKERGRPPLRLTNAVLDWHNTTEFCSFLQQSGNKHGWIDPDEYFSFGSCSRENTAPQIMRREPLLQIDQRRWTLLTLDRGTSAGKGQPSFYDKAILPLVILHDEEPERDNVYAWMDIMARSCAGKPLAYISAYQPSARLRKAAARHKVTLIHVPLQVVPATLRRRNQHFRFMAVPRSHYIKVMNDRYEKRL